MFAFKETVDDEYDNDHKDYQKEDGECGYARAGAKVDGVGVEDRVM